MRWVSTPSPGFAYVVARSPTVYEAVTAGCAVVVPLYDPPRDLHQLPARPARSQHPYIVEQLGSPYAHEVSFSEQHTGALAALLQQLLCVDLPPGLRRELSREEFTRRVAVSLRDPSPCLAETLRLALVSGAPPPEAQQAMDVQTEDEQTYYDYDDY